MPDMTVTLDALFNVRNLYDLSFMPGFDEPRLWRIEQYLVYRLERVGLAAPLDAPTDGAVFDLADLGGSD